MANFEILKTVSKRSQKRLSRKRFSVSPKNTNKNKKNKKEKKRISLKKSIKGFTWTIRSVIKWWLQSTPQQRPGSRRRWWWWKKKWKNERKKSDKSGPQDWKRDLWGALIYVNHAKAWFKLNGFIEWLFFVTWVSFLVGLSITQVKSQAPSHRRPTLPACPHSQSRDRVIAMIKWFPPIISVSSEISGDNNNDLVASNYPKESHLSKIRPHFLDSAWILIQSGRVGVPGFLISS